jgi:hypothetical protein
VDEKEFEFDGLSLENRYMLFEPGGENRWA